MSETILFAIEGDIARITINNPDKRNALSLGDLTAISGHLGTAADADIRALIITGAGEKAFCSGGDQNVKSFAGYIGSDGVPRLNILDLQKQSLSYLISVFC